MADAETEFRQEERRKDNKKKNIFITLFIIFTLLGVIIGTIFGLFYVDDKSNVEISENSNVSSLIRESMSKSVDNTAENNKINFQIREEVINTLLYYGLDIENNSDLNKYVTRVYTRFRNNNVIWIVADLKLAFFKSQARLHLSFEQVNEGEQDNWHLKIKINKVVLGRVTSFENLIINALIKNNVDDSINSALKNAKLSLNVDFSTKEIIYYYKDLVSDLRKIFEVSETNQTESEIGLYLELLNELLVGDNFVTFNTTESDSFNLDLDATRFKLNGNSEKEMKLDFDNRIKANIEKLYEKNKEQCAQKDVLYALTYFLIHGNYERFSTEDQKYIDSIDFSDISEEIGDIKEYKGFEQIVDASLIDTLVDTQLSATQATNLITSGGDFVLLSDDDISNSIKNRIYFLGYGNIVSRIEDDKLIYNYLLTKDFYCTIDEDKAIFYVVFSVNGYDCNLILNTSVKQNETNNYLVNFQVDSVQLGDYTLKTDLYDIFLDVLGRSFNNIDTGSILTIDSKKDDSKGSINFDFSIIKSNDNVKNAITTAESNNKKLSFKFEDDSIKLHFE